MLLFTLKSLDPAGLSMLEKIFYHAWNYCLSLDMFSNLEALRCCTRIFESFF